MAWPRGWGLPRLRRDRRLLREDEVVTHTHVIPSAEHGALTGVSFGEFYFLDQSSIDAAWMGWIVTVYGL